MKGKIFYSLFLIILLFPVSSSSDEFLGVFTTDTYPVDGCKIIRAGDLINIAQRMRNSERDDFTNENNYLKKLSNSMLDNRFDLMTEAKKSGYNAIVGYQVVVAQHFDGFNGSVVNRDIGIGHVVVMVQGVPVTVTCKRVGKNEP